MLLPEETFTPFPMKGTTCDICLGGLRFETTETTEDYYRLITQRIRYARIITVLPGSSQEVTLSARVAWVQFNRTVFPPVCTYGFAFENLKPEERETVKRCVELNTKDTAPGASGERYLVEMEEK